ncbi:phosphatidylethanolamine-binding protein [Mycena crocata]|nr:phosphatidylethanolamine-binding protein [Mycena crocata]
MISLTLISLALLSSVANAATTALDIEAIEAHFKQSLIVPQLLTSFTPGAVLSVAFSGKEITPGQALEQSAVGTKPVVTVSALNATLTGKFTITMVDADVVGADESGGVNRHWLENGVTVASDTVSDTSATTITAYAGPGPAPGSGPHRLDLLRSPSLPAARRLLSPSDLATTVEGVHKFDLSAYVKDSGLGEIVAANYFTVEAGTSSASVPATSAVVTSTLQPAGASASGGAAASAAASGSGSATNPSGSPAPTGAAIKFELNTAAAILAAGAMLVLL